DLQAPLANGEVVITATELDATHLDDTQTPALGAVVDGQLFQHDHAVGDGVKLEITDLGCLIVEQNHRTASRGEEVLERQYLTPVAQRALRQQAHFRKA